MTKHYIAVVVRGINDNEPNYPADGAKRGEFLLLNKEGHVIDRFNSYDSALEELIRLNS